ncbi:hypothetical protein V5O48_007021 [Marasmius crinis-equi]|uniref:Uncharacterized protein n=1 Tax=Marasmius crinis-equi TaxID=585013 RepID=A0ABR3FHY1_9AGAR
MDAFLSEEKKQKKKNKKDKKNPIPHTDLTPFTLPDAQRPPPWATSSNPGSGTFSPVLASGASTPTMGFAPPSAPWLNDGETSILSSSTGTARGRGETRDGYETDATTGGGRSKSRGGKLRKRSKSRPRKGASGDAGYETDDGYMSSGPAPDKTLNKSKSKSRFFKLGNRSKSHVPSDDEREPPPPLPVPQPPPQPQFRLPIAARFATTLGDVNRGALVEPPVIPQQEEKKQPSYLTTGNGSLELSRPDSVDFSTAMSKAFASTSSQQESPTKQRGPLVHFQDPIIPTTTSSAAPSSYHPTPAGYERNSAGSGTSSSEQTSSSGFHSSSYSTSSHATTSTAASSVVSSSPPVSSSGAGSSAGTGLFSRFGSKRIPSGDKEKESRTQISYPITRSSSPGPSPPSGSPPTVQRQISPTTTNAPPSAFNSSPPTSGRTTPSSERKGNVPRPLFLHRVPSSDHVTSRAGSGGGRAEPELTYSPATATPSPGGSGYVVLTPGLGSGNTGSSVSPKTRPTPSNLVIPNSSYRSSSSPSPAPSPVPSASYIVPSPSEPVFAPQPPTSYASPASATARRLRSRASEENMNLRARTRVSEDTFSPPPPPQVFTIPPATPPPSSPLPDVPPSQVSKQESASVFASQQQQSNGVGIGGGLGSGLARSQSHLRAPSPSPGLPSSPSSTLRGRESPFPAKPASPYRPPVSKPKEMDLDGFGGRVKVRRYAELYGFGGGGGSDSGHGQGQWDEDDTISTSGGRLPVRRDDEEEWREARARARDNRERERDRASPLPAGLHVPSQSESERWKRHKPRQSTQVGINVEEPSDIEDEGYGGEEYANGAGYGYAGMEDEDDGARYYRGMGYDVREREEKESALGRSRSFEALQQRLRDPKSQVAPSGAGRRARRSEEELYEQSEDGHSSSQHSHSLAPSRRSDENQRRNRRIPIPPVPISPSASDDSHYSANGRFTMYEDEDASEVDFNARSTMYSDAASFLDESRSRNARDRFIQRVEGMYDTNGRERERVPPVPSTYLSASGRISPNPPHSVNDRLAGLASGRGVGRGGRAISPVPPVPNLPKGAVVGIVGENGEVVSSKLWI